jgi:TPR repeat protein
MSSLLFCLFIMHLIPLSAEIRDDSSNQSLATDTASSISTDVGHSDPQSQTTPSNQKQHLPPTIESVLPRAESGDVNAQFTLGHLYEDPYAKNKDFKEAFRWFLLAAQGGQAMAQQRVANAYEWGRGVDRNPQEAQRWYSIFRQTLLRQCDDPKRQSGLPERELGEVYARGLGVPKNDVEAFSWYSKSADKGNVWGFYEVGDFYASGRGVPRDVSKATSWLQKAKDAGNERAAIKLAALLGEKDPEKGATMTEEECQKFIGRLKDSGEGWQLKVADRYSIGLDLPKNPVEARRWYEIAADTGDARAAVKIARMYEIGLGAPRDPAQALFWRKKAAALGDSESEYIVAWSFSSGQGVAQDPVEALKWFTKAAEHGNTSAPIALADAYFYGKGTERDPAKAGKLLKDAADRGNARASMNLSTYVKNKLLEEMHGVEEGSFKGGVGYYPMLANEIMKKADNCASGSQAQKKYLEEWVSLYEQAADTGNHSAILILGEAYINGLTRNGNTLIPKDVPKGLIFYEKYATNNSYAAYNLGCLLTQGKTGQGAFIPKDVPKGIKWLETAVDMNDGFNSYAAAQNLGGIYKGSAGPSWVNADLSFYWLKRSAELGSVWAAKELATAYSSGHGVIRDAEVAEKWSRWAEELEKRKESAN